MKTENIEELVETLKNQLKEACGTYQTCFKQFDVRITGKITYTDFCFGLTEVIPFHSFNKS